MIRRDAIALLVVATLGFGCSLTGGCDNSDARRLASPNGRWAAWVFIRSCGATTGGSMQVSVLPASAAAPTEAGNVFVIEQGSGVTAEWLGPARLEISYPRGSEIFKKLTDTGEVKIAYDER